MEQAHERVKVLIIGSGFSGIAMARRLKKQGIEDFVMLERAPEVGGVWNHNTYPGCTCDVPSHLYSFSFAPNPEWSQTYSPQPEIHEYLRRCADKLGIRPHLRTGVEFVEAAWRDDEQLWEVETSAGTFAASVLVSGMGPLTEPKLPNVPGMERFEGKTMHSARWDHDYDLAGKRVASIGTGASAIQYVPAIQPDVEQLFVLQRTPPWVMPHGNRPINDWERSLYRRLPIAQRLVRGAVYLSKELLVLGFAKRPKLMGLLEKVARTHRERHISDPQLLADVTPDYALGCKRLLPSNKWYPALTKDNVELVPAGLAEIRERSVVDTTGAEREVDTIIFGTGFHVTDMPLADQVRGRGGQLLADRWQGSPRAYLGTSVPGFPNLFTLLGPNTGLGHSSMIYMAEAQVEHIARVIAAMDRAGAAAVEVTSDAHDAYNRTVDSGLDGSVWDTGGCTSFYFDASGRNATLWPDFTWRFRGAGAPVDAGAYRLEAPRPALAPA